VTVPISPLAPSRSPRSFVPRARSAVAACSRLAAAASIAAIVASLGACLQTQELGAADAGATRDAKSTGETGASPDADLDFQLSTADIDTSKCPGTAPPEPGTPCPTNLHVEGMSPVQCSYAKSFSLAGVHICARTCVCAFDGRWSCIDAPCAPPSRRACSEGMPCLGTGCSFGCESGDPATCRSCKCGVEQRLSCGKVPTP
jgi:hypothetical protein